MLAGHRGFADNKKCSNRVAIYLYIFIYKYKKALSVYLRASRVVIISAIYFNGSQGDTNNNNNNATVATFALQPFAPFTLFAADFLSLNQILAYTRVVLVSKQLLVSISRNLRADRSTRCELGSAGLRSPEAGPAEGRPD